MAAFAVARGASAETLEGVIFSTYSPLSNNAELVRRLLTPLTAMQLAQAMVQTGKHLAPQPVDLAQESFVIYVPARKPPGGYGLIVFVPPWNDAKVPPGWTDALDERGLVLVTAAKSGNNQSTLGRREPLALLAEQNVVQRYQIDPARIYISGFSGGSRVAMRLALGYPDIFRGAILNSGSDAMDIAGVALPPKDLFALFRDRTRLVYVTGENDTFVRQRDVASMRAMRELCVSHVDDIEMSGVGHQTASGAELSLALDLVEKPPVRGADDTADCRSALDAEIAAKLQSVRSLIAAGRRDDARALLVDVDRRFGGLAAPESTDIAQSLAP